MCEKIKQMIQRASIELVHSDYLSGWEIKYYEKLIVTLSARLTSK